MSSNKQFAFDIFLSYNWDHKPFVEKLYNKLCNELNFKVWLDDKELDHTPLSKQLADGINKSQVFMCCITKKYSESRNCREELLFAFSKNKPPIILMFEHYNEISEEIQMKINLERR